MKNNQFEKGLAIFAECTNRDSNNLEAQYLLGVCAFHLEHHDEAITHFTELLTHDPQYRKNAYLFLAISHKKNQNLEESLHVVLVPLSSSLTLSTTTPNTSTPSSSGPRSSPGSIGSTTHSRTSTRA